MDSETDKSAGRHVVNADPRVDQAYCERRFNRGAYHCRLKNSGARYRHKLLRSGARQRAFLPELD